MNGDKENWYAPGEVRTHMMTEEEKKKYAPQKHRYPWRMDRKCRYDMDAHVAENENSIFKRTYRLRKK